MSLGTVHGRFDPEFAPVRDAFARCFAELGEIGAATCVYHRGVPVVDLWAGVADPAVGREWRRDTLVHTYSVSKPFAALCLLRLVDRGAVELDAPVARYWPEFAQAGKERIAVRWLLTHQAGLLGLRAPLPGEAILDWERIVSLLAAEEPWWEPGTRHGEHALFFGHLVGEVVRRVSGKRLGAFLHDELTAPWELDFHVGLGDAELARCAAIVGLDEAWRASILDAPRARWRQALDNPPGRFDGDVINGEAWRRAEIPAVNGHGSAHAVARFYGGLGRGGELDGVRLLSARLVREALSSQSSGDDVVLGEPVNWGLGFRVDSDGFGLGGIGGSLGWGNLEHEFGFAYLTNRMGTHERALSVYAAAARAAGFEPVV